MNEQINPIRSALYYPFPFIKDDNWLKRSALFWDNIYRIVPPRFTGMYDQNENIQSEQSELAKIFLNELDFIKDYEVGTSSKGEKDSYSAASKLLSLIQSFPEYFDSKQEPDKNYFSWGQQELSKASYFVATKLEKKGAVSFNKGCFRFKDFPGQIYMALLAQTISAKAHIPIVTDDYQHDLTLKSYLLTHDEDKFIEENDENWYLEPDNPGEIPSGETQAMALCNLTFNSIGINDLSNISPKTIIKIRKRYDSERKDFVNEVQKFITELKGKEIQSENQLSYLIKDKAEELERKRISYEKAINGLGVGTVFELIKVGAILPIVDKIAKYFLTPEPTALVISGTLGIGAALYKTYYDRLKDRRTNPSIFYLSQISKTIKREQYFQKLEKDLSQILKNKIL
jgi:hypothetical protein